MTKMIKQYDNYTPVHWRVGVGYNYICVHHIYITGQSPSAPLALSGSIRQFGLLVLVEVSGVEPLSEKAQK
jgi:hypothetical protein